MIEVFKTVTESSFLFHFADVMQFLTPQAGVGGGVEAKEHVELLPVIRSTFIFLAAIGAVFGLGLAFAAKKFSVKVNPRVEQVKDVLAHAH